MGRSIITVGGCVGATALTLWIESLGVPAYALLLVAIVCYGIVAVVAWWDRWKVAWIAFWHLQRSTETTNQAPAWQFEPRTILMEIRNLNLNGVTRAEPLVSVDVVLENLCGRDIQITGIRSGRMHVAGEQCGMPAIIQRPVTLRSRAHDHQALTIQQPITAALGRTLSDGLGIRSTPHTYAFDLGALELEGILGTGASAVPLPPCRVCPSWFRVKGPMGLGVGLEPNIIRLDAMFVSQLEYNSEGDRITS